ncbi:hypothetical protein JF544_12070 [Halobacillus kuroshimensis]|uniref:Uncharacterized protein n=1 Tax=Halobacillus kuroshimensis TaxID=302481 RepID=A0ABS3DXE9_9BACI|nr:MULTISPECIES: hypothetical protein [Halobacillus]MBN8235992.1 hypothetical protein [Halobacillus kuroshimensis]
MEFRPMRKQRVIPGFPLLFISGVMLALFLSLSVVTNNYNYTAASVVSVIIMNVALASPSIRKSRKKSLR